jgi:hypothetical protein
MAARLTGGGRFFNGTSLGLPVESRKIERVENRVLFVWNTDQNGVKRHEPPHKIE